MASFRNHKVSCSEILPSYQQAGEVELREHPFEETGKTEGEYVKSDSHQDILVDNAKNSAYNNELLRKRRKRLIFILLIAAVTTVLLVVVATVPFLLGSRKPTDDMNSGDVKKATGEEEQTQCQSFSHLVANGHLVCNGEDVNSTCWTVCIEGYKKEDSLIGSYMCGLNGQWSGEATTCVPKDCGTPYQNGTAKEVQPCPKPPGVCQIPIRDGVLNCTGTTYRHSCEVTCNDNFRGNLSFLVCESDGRWSSLDVGCLPEDPCTNNTCNKVNGSCIQVSNNQHALCRCNVGFAGNGIHCQLDSDLDGFPDVQLPCEEKHCKVDNCPLIPNSGQENSDQDPDGNVCDFDDDNDHINDTNDNCQFDSNPGQEDRDNDTIGDACDNCINVFNTDQTDTDGDGTGDVCEPGGDVDNDGVSRGDNCRVVPNPGQEDRDRDGVGDVCDNCADVSNMQQNDTDQNLIGDACEEKADNDGDGVSDGRDNCQSLPNGDQLDCDTDMLGDACDSDQDGDGILNNQDNCPLVSNPDQADKDGDGVGDVCVGDTDGDGIMDYQDDYPLNKFLNRTDFSLYQEVLLDDEGKAQVPPKWIIFDKGQAVVQTANGNPGLMLSYTKFGHLDYTGTFYISDTRDDDFAGLVFGYQSNRHFYVCSWKKLTQTYNIPGLPYPRSVGRRGIHLMAINSTTGPGESLRDALWETGNTINQSHMLWYDPAPRWNVGVAYRWRLIHDPDSGRIRIRWYNGTKLISDSGNIVDKRYRGGRVGMYVFSQEGVHYSALHARSPKITDYVLSLDGVDEYGDLGAFSDILDQNSSFTLAAWVWITGANGQTICSLPPIDFGNLTPDLGFLLQSVDDEENWKLIKTRTPTANTGPTADHTSGSGFYAYLESSAIAKGNRASLETPWFATSDGCNVSFFYHMFDNSSSGDSMGTLCVEVKTEREPWFMVFWRGGNQGNSWHHGNVDLSVYKGLVAVRFTAAKGKSYYSDIALDDVSFSPSCGVSSACSRPEVLPIFGTKEGTGVHLSVSGGKVQGGVSHSQPIKGNLSFAYNTWTHVAFQYSSETKQQSLYVNGRLDQVVNNASFNLISKNLLLGQNGAKNFRGQIDEVQIWKFPVNESVFYDKYLEGNEKGLVRYFKCNDREENKLKDSSPSKKDGLLHGTGRLSSSLELKKQD